MKFVCSAASYCAAGLVGCIFLGCLYVILQLGVRAATAVCHLPPHQYQGRRLSCQQSHCRLLSWRHTALAAAAAVAAGQARLHPQVAVAVPAAVLEC